MRVEEALANFTKVQYALSTMATLLHFTDYRYPKPATVNDEDTFDYIVVGAGSTGSVVATRLSEDPNVSVLLIEAGDYPPIESNLASLQQYLQYSRNDWFLKSQVDKVGYQCIVNNQLPLTQGKMMGGSSAMNLMWYVIGDPHDFDVWAELVGDTSWNYENVLPYFIKHQHFKDQKILNSPYRKFYGTDGPIGVTKLYSKGATKYLNVYKELGFNTVLDTNANGSLGFTEVSVSVADHLRQSTANTYLARAKDRSNLHVLKKSRATKIIIDKLKVARGVEFIDENNNKKKAKARKEVIISAGALHSPQLLQLSGIGNKIHLEKLGINVEADLPVGQQLLNHHGILMVFKTGKEDGKNKPPPSHPGDLSTPMVVGFVALNKSQTYPDYQSSSMILSAESFASEICAINFAFDTATCQSLYNDIVGREILFVEIQGCSYKSRGWVSLKSANPFDDPYVHLVAYPDEEVFETVLSCAEDFYRVVNTTYFKEVNGELANLPQCMKYDKNSKEYLRCYGRCMSSTIFHYGGTCAMGQVVDSRLRVHGIKRLRVADASVMPRLTSGNINAPCMMIGEKAADMIKEDNKNEQQPYTAEFRNFYKKNMILY